MRLSTLTPYFCKESIEKGGQGGLVIPYHYSNAPFSLAPLQAPLDSSLLLDTSPQIEHLDQDGYSSINGTVPLAGFPALRWQVGQPVSGERAGPVEESVVLDSRSVDDSDRR